MKASETKLLRIIEGTNQYLVPHFQRPYTWERKNWETLWEDIEALLAPNSTASSPPEHFMGAIVTAPAHSVPEGVTKYLLIDGQQRLTTLLLVLAAIRDRARQLDDNKLANKIHELYLTNRYTDGPDQYKLLPTKGDEQSESDRTAFVAIVENQEPPSANALTSGYKHFAKAVSNRSSDDLQALTNALVSHVFLVSIVLERDDNPYAIFESLNAKGQPLSQADLVRNFFFMSIDSSKHDDIYARKWIPMERAMGREHLETYIRHFLMRKGDLVKESEVYFTLKKTVEAAGREQAERLLDELVRVSKHYECFLEPEREKNLDIRTRLVRLNRLRATVSYPFLLNVFEDRANKKLTDSDIVKILDVIENFIVRRYICNTMRAELNELFTVLYKNASRFSRTYEGVREILGSRNYPTDQDFLETLQTKKLYGAGEARDRAKLILERLEESWMSKEQIDASDLTIEHVMPQTLTDWWKDHLGEAASETHELYLHSIGNLTLTGYNSVLSNDDFPRKCQTYRESKLSLNRELSKFARWTRDEIEARALALAQQALNHIWPSFAPQANGTRSTNVQGTSPKKLVVLGNAFSVQSWQDVLRLTLTQICELGSDVVDQLAVEFPKMIKRSPDGLRVSRQLANGIYYESNLNAVAIHRLCSQIAQQVGLSSQEWQVETDASSASSQP
jgi:uncharacterized protein with ParB-like and HNH nuclease domain